MRALSHRYAVGAVIALWPALACPAVKRDIEEDLIQLRSGKPLAHSIPDASTRVAVFAYQDPDRTGLGDAVAAIVGREILLHARVASIGLIAYQGSLSGSASDTLSYFEKVDQLTAAQDVTLAVWGAVRKGREGLVIDTFAQVPGRTLRESFDWVFRLPPRVGPESLVAELGPDRILVQRLEVPAAAAEGIRRAARVLDQLREEPLDSSPPVAGPPKNTVYWFERIEGEWARVRFAGSSGGWIRSAGHCTGSCAPLLDGAWFVAGLLRFAERRDVPKAAKTLAPDALAIRDQLEALRLMNQAAKSGGDAAARASDLLRPWRRRISKGQAVPGGAALANIDALVDVLLSLKTWPPPPSPGPVVGPGKPALRYDRLVLLPEDARAIAFRLAEASQLDPRNEAVLHNLAVLFTIAGDGERATLARELAQKVDSDRRGPRGVAPEGGTAR